jgi:hypothetical protein
MSIEYKTLQEYANDYSIETGNSPRDNDNWSIEFVVWFCKKMNGKNKFNPRM